MKTKKSGVFAALAIVLLLAAALITSCPEPFGSGGFEVSNDGPEFQPPPGMGYVKLNLGNSNGRTIVPTGSIANSAYDSFTLSVYESPATPGGAPGTAVTMSPAGPYTTEALLQAASGSVTVGTNYTVEVNASISGVATASGTAIFTAIAGSNSVPIALSPVFGTTGSGTFAWSLTYDGSDFTSLDSATLTGIGASIDLTDTPSGTRNITPGSYPIKVTLELDGYSTFVRNDVVHIYNTMTSSFGIAGTPVDFSALISVPTYAVTFNNPTSAGGTEVSITYTHGEVLNANVDYIAEPLPTTEPTTPGVGDFLGWFTLANGNGTKVALSSKVFQALNLYGNWYSTTLVGVGTVTFVPPPDEGTVLQLDSLSISRTTLFAAPPATNTVTLTVTGLTDFTSPQILIGGHTVSGNSITIGYGGTPNIDDLLFAGNIFAITIVATKDGKNYSNVILVNVVP